MTRPTRTRAANRPSAAPEPASQWGPVEGALLAAVVVVALAIRVYEPWSLVFTPAHLNLLETDAWYHFRVIENLVAQFPHRLIVDPYAAPGGMYVPIAPLFDLLVAGAAWLAGFGHPSAAVIGRVAVFTPPLLGAATVVMVCAAARVSAGTLAGLLAAALAAILPGHFLDRTLLGFVDHHALEALMSVAILWMALRILRDGEVRLSSGVAMGALFAAYSLTWTSAAFLFGIVAVWLVLHGSLHLWRRIDVGGVGGTMAVAAAVALTAAVACRPINPYRFDLQVAGLAAVLVAGLGVEAARTAVRAGRRPRLVVGVGAAAAAIALAAAIVLLPGLVRQVATELGRFTASPDRMQVLEARPLLLYDGRFSWRPAWFMFRTGLPAALVAIVFLVWRWLRAGSPGDLLLAVWCTALALATFGQNRFGYYLVPSAAVVIGCVAARVIEAGRRAGGWRRRGAVIAVAGLLFGPNLAPAIWTTGRPGGLPADWLPAFTWLRYATADPFGDPAYYDARYGAGRVRRASYSVMAWWDDGYWIIQAAHRVPVANPTQERADVAGRFFAETDERRALAILRDEHARYVFVDDRLPFRIDPASNTVLGSFESIAIWAGVPTSRFFGAFLLPDGRGYRTVFLYYPDYYRSMTFRLGVLGGAGSAATAPAVVASWTATWIPSLGGSYPVLTTLNSFATYEAATTYLHQLGPGNHLIAGVDPSRSPVPLESITGAPPRLSNPGPWGVSGGCGSDF